LRHFETVYQITQTKEAYVNVKERNINVVALPTALTCKFPDFGVPALNRIRIVPDVPSSGFVRELALRPPNIIHKQSTFAALLFPPQLLRLLYLLDIVIMVSAKGEKWEQYRKEVRHGERAGEVVQANWSSMPMMR
jgi:hypothetical protein